MGWNFVSQETVKVEDTNSEVWHNAALTLYQAGNYEKSLFNINKAIYYGKRDHKYKEKAKKYGLDKFKIIGDFVERLLSLNKHGEVVTLLKKEYPDICSIPSISMFYFWLFKAEWGRRNIGQAFAYYVKYYIVSWTFFFDLCMIILLSIALFAFL